MSGVSSPVYGDGGGYGSSFPSSVDYAYIVAKAKVGLDAAITGPTSFGLRFKVPASPGVVAGGLSTTETSLEFTDGTNTATLTTTLPAAGEDVVVAVELADDFMRLGRLGADQYDYAVGFGPWVPFSGTIPSWKS